MPFMLAQKYANPWAYMTAYNKLNGIYCSENPTLLRDILRKEWKFDGMVRLYLPFVDPGSSAVLGHERLDWHVRRRWRCQRRLGPRDARNE